MWWRIPHRKRCATFSLNLKVCLFGTAVFGPGSVSYTHLEKPSNSAPHPLVGGAERGLAFINWIWNGPFFPRAILSLFLLFVIVKGLSQVHFDDDIRLLQKTPTHVVQEAVSYTHLNDISDARQKGVAFTYQDGNMIISSGRVIIE